jgi:hypothetical protein
MMEAGDLTRFPYPSPLWGGMARRARVGVGDSRLISHELTQILTIYQTPTPALRADPPRKGEGKDWRDNLPT